MAKVSGGTRKLKNKSREYNKRQKEVESMRASGKYSSVEIGTHGGYLAVEKSKAIHKSEEIEAGKILADNGYKVILKDEMGQVKTPDGYIFNASFEQRTPTKDGANTIRNALFHAKSKNAQVAVIYSKNSSFTRKSVDDGLKLFEQATERRFDRIIVVSDNGYIHIHKHNK